MITEIFKRQFAERRVCVGKTYVAEVLRRSKSDIVYLRRTIKHRIPRPLPRNRTWALDLTGKTDLTGRQHMLLGLLDHGTRACLELAVLPDKRSLTILKAVISAFRRYGLPTRLRVDNEICLNSRLMRGALALLGVRLQATELHCPWQNGRIECFFGTLKQKLDTIIVADGHALALQLGAFWVWYNQSRSFSARGEDDSRAGASRPESASSSRCGKRHGREKLSAGSLRRSRRHSVKTRTAMAGIEATSTNSQRIGVMNSPFHP